MCVLFPYRRDSIFIKKGCAAPYACRSLVNTAEIRLQRVSEASSGAVMVGVKRKVVVDPI